MFIGDLHKLIKSDSYIPDALSYDIKDVAPDCKFAHLKELSDIYEDAFKAYNIGFR
jgi:hypothetical protein